MNELLSLGIILLLALLAGHVVKLLRIPEVTGHLLAGIALGPSVLGWISGDNLSALEILSEVALGLILFSIGTAFELERFERHASTLLRISVCETLCTFAVVTASVSFAGQQWRVALLLGVMAMETAAATTLMVLREMNAEGPLTEMLTAAFALDNLACLFGFNIVVTIIQFTGGGAAGESPMLSIVRLVWQFAGAMALGYTVGFLLSMWSPHVVEHGEQLILLAGCVLLSVGASKWLDVSPLVANLTIGATVANYSARTRTLYSSLTKTDPPLYAIFFVLAGADLDIRRLPSLGLIGACYVLARFAAKYLGVWMGASIGRAETPIRRWLPPSMFAQAGLAVGLSLTLGRRLPSLATPVNTVVLSAVMIFEIIGPILARRSIIKAGESKPETEPASIVIG
ncbi:MAG TPA: cation:proton antiporter [Bryobacteraceae bacterium]|nr:cation:proton antiporter [Bryobacteraceae bacterium]